MDEISGNKVSSAGGMTDPMQAAYEHQNHGDNNWTQQQTEVTKAYQSCANVQEIDGLYELQKVKLTNEGAPKEAFSAAEFSYTMAKMSFESR